MAKYDYGIIDAEFLLRRNWSIQRNSNLNQGLLMKSFLQSVMKLKREVDFARPLLLFDKSPYFKTMEAVEEYKQDRYYATESELDQLNSRLQMEGLTDDERKHIESEISRVKKEISDFRIRSDVKYDLVSNGRSIGMVTLIKQGFEADDIAFALAEKVREMKKKAILITTDHDWISFRSPEVDYSTPKYDHRNSDCRALVLDSRRLNLPLYEIGVLREIYHNSHNNVSSYDFCEEVDFDSFCKRLTSGDQTLPGFEKVNRVYQAMNIRKHLPELDGMINFALSDLTLDLNTWNDFIHSRNINIPYYRFIEFKKGI